MVSLTSPTVSSTFFTASLALSTTVVSPVGVIISSSAFSASKASLPRDIPAASKPAVNGSPPVSSAIAAELSPLAPAVPKVPKSAPVIRGSAKPPKPPVRAAVKGSPPVTPAVAAPVKAPVRAVLAAPVAPMPEDMLPANGPNKPAPAIAGRAACTTSPT